MRDCESEQHPDQPEERTHIGGQEYTVELVDSRDGCAWVSSGAHAVRADPPLAFVRLTLDRTSGELRLRQKEGGGE